MTTETVALPEAGTRIHPSNWPVDDWIDVIAAAYNEQGRAHAFGPDYHDFLGCWSLDSGWELVVDENIEKLAELLDRTDCPIHVVRSFRSDLIEFLVANGVTAS